MTLRKILHFPNSKLRLKAKPVEKVDHSVRQLIDDMIETMYESRGVGLAATQIDVQLAVVVIDISEKRDDIKIFINPEILETSGEQQCEEGCLSVPGIYENVKRFKTVKIKALDRVGKPFELQAEGYLSVCIQHEIDHLHGKLFVDLLSPLKRQLIKKKLKKIQRTSM